MFIHRLNKRINFDNTTILCSLLICGDNSLCNLAGFSYIIRGATIRKCMLSTFIGRYELVDNFMYVATSFHWILLSETELLHFPVACGFYLR